MPSCGAITVKAYEGLLALGDEDPLVRQQMADVLHSIVGLNRELEHHTEAAAALARSARLYEALVETDPGPPAIRETLGVVQMDLAYTWQFDIHSPSYKAFPIEAQYRRALNTFEAIEHDWPERRQPVTLCLHSIARLTIRRGDRDQAEQLWKQAISRGEAYLEQRPASSQVQTDLCWACVEYYEEILSKKPKRKEEASSLLSLGEKHAKLMLSRNPESVQATDVLAALHIRQALVECNAGRTETAIPILEGAIHEIHSLCESVPWNADYWNSTCWFHEVAIQELSKAKQGGELDSCITQIAKWFQKLDERIADDATAKQKLREATVAFAKNLRSIGLNTKADDVLSPRAAH